MQLSHRHSLELRLDVTVRIKFLAFIAAGFHPFPSRTRQLSPPAPMIVGPQGPSKVGRRQINLTEEPATVMVAGFLHSTPFPTCCEARRYNDRRLDSK